MGESRRRFRWNVTCYVSATMRMLMVAFLLLAPAFATAQQQPSPAPVVPAGREPDIAIVAAVRAREVRFERSPDVQVQVWGEINGRPAATVSTTDRQNLPDAVQPYVTYRDIGIVLTITSTLPDIETILDEALAAAPSAVAASSEAAPKPSPRTTPTSKPPARKQTRR